jgi:nitroreductase
MNEIFHRVSIRSYQNKPVEDEKIEQILRAAMAAPSACNQQPWEFYVVTDRNLIRKLAKTSQYSLFAAEAPLLIIPCYRTDNLIKPKYALQDLSGATENMLLEIDSLGLGGVWLGIAPSKKRMSYVEEVIPIKEGLHVFSMVAVGYPEKTRKQENRFDPDRIHRIP